MQFLIDSDHLIDHLAGRQDAVQLVSGLIGKGLGASVLSAMEVLEGVKFGRDPATARTMYDQLMGAIALLPVNEEVIEIASDIRGQLRTAGRSVSDRAIDIPIAATAIEHNLPLVTRNEKHFGDIPGLRIWRDNSVAG